MFRLLTAPSRWWGALDEERDAHHVLGMGRFRGIAADLVGPEAATVIGRDDDQRFVVDGKFASQSIEQLSEEPVDELDLEQMALPEPVSYPPVLAAPGPLRLGRSNGRGSSDVPDAQEV